MNYQSSLKKVKQGKYQYIYVYFKSSGKIIRINTGHKFEQKFINKDLTFNSKKINYKELNQKTSDIKQKVDDYIKFKIQLNDLSNISKKECEDFIRCKTSNLNPTIPHKTTNQELVLNLLNEFYQYKRKELNYRPSFKDYLSLYNSFHDYQKYYSTELTLETINSLDFLVSYRDFLSMYRGSEFLTRGGLNDNTINKRFTSLRSFYKWLENKDIFQFKKSIHSFNISRFENNIVVLSKVEIRNLLELRFINKTWEKVRDVFVCNCFLGLRYSDIITLRKSDFFIDDEGDYILLKENKKTNYYVQVPVQKTPLGILNKYDFNLPKLTLQYFNRELKKLFVEYNLFSEPIIKKRRVNKVNQDFEVLKRDLITTHTCRRTFITLGISNNVPLNSLMLSTGHRRIQTLQFYMKKVLDKGSFGRIDL